MKFGIMGSYGAGNIGDETILRGIVQQIREVDPKAEIYIFTHSEKYTKQVFPDCHALEVLPAGVRSKTKQQLLFRLRKSYNILKELDSVLVGGGGIFYDHLFSSGKNPVKVWHTRLQQVHSLGVPICIYAVGVTDLKYEESRECMKDICDMAQHITVRDAFSKERLKLLGVKKHIDIIPDPAWFAKFDEVTSKPKYIGVNIRSWRLMDESCPDHIEIFAKYLEWLSDKAPLKFLPFSWRKDNDLEYLGELLERVNLEIETPILETPEIAFEEVSSCKCIIGMRLHSQIFSIKAHRPLGAIAYHDKVNTQLEGFNVPILQVKELSFENLCDLTEQAMAQSPNKITADQKENPFKRLFSECVKEKS